MIKTRKTKKAVVAEAQQVVRTSRKNNLISPENEAWGTEPVYDRLITPRELDDALTWYGSNMSYKDGRNALARFLEPDNKPLAKKVLAAGESYFPPTLFGLARLINNGATLPSYAMERITKYLAEGEAKYEIGVVEKLQEKEFLRSIEDEEKNRPKFGILKEENVALVLPVVEAIENMDTKFNVAEYLSGKVEGPTIDKLIIFLNSEFSISEDLELKAHFNGIINKIKSLGGIKEEAVVEKVRKPRKKKVIPVEKKVANVKLLPEYTEFGLKGVSNASIIGAKVLWFYDTRYTRLVNLRCKEETGFEVKGTTVLNYNPETSGAKRLGRKAKVIIENLQKAGKVDLRKFMEGIKTSDCIFTGRMNENMILVKVEK